MFESTGSGQCATGACHGGTNAPTILDNNPATTYTNLKAYSINGNPLINVGNTNPADSSLECDLGITQPVCGLGQMPQAPGALGANQWTSIDTWVKCGSPEQLSP